MFVCVKVPLCGELCLGIVFRSWESTAGLPARQETVTSFQLFDIWQ